jgi:hypothetical protein
MIKRGVLFNGSNFVSYAHHEHDVDRAVEAYDGALRVLAEALPDDLYRRLEGPPLTAGLRTPS